MKLTNDTGIGLYIEWTLLALILGLLIYAYIEGSFIKNTIQIVEICNGQPTSMYNFTLLT